MNESDILLPMDGRFQKIAWGGVVWMLLLSSAAFSQDFIWTTNSPFTNSVTITGYTGGGGDVVIPETLDGKTVTSISNAFRYCRTMTSISIPQSVMYIEAGSFSYCTNLASVLLPSGIRTIRSRTFEGCGLTNVSIPSGVTNIGSYAFDNCARLISVVIPSNVKDIELYAFSSCRSITNVTIPSSVKRIGSSAFMDCDSLPNIMIPDSVTSIGSYALALCNGLTEINVSASHSVFSSSNGVLFNKNRTALIQCPGGIDGSYIVPGSIQTIGVGAFDGCDRMTDIEIPGSVTNLGYGALSRCTSLTNVIMSTNITSIGHWAFSGCTSLPHIAIPDGITCIELRTYSSCSSLTKMTIPAGVTSIREYAFKDCSNLTGVYFSGDVPSLPLPEYGVFDQTTNVTVYRLPRATGWPLVPGLWADRPTALWFPEIQEEGLGVNSNEFRFNINWADGQTIVVEACTNLTDPVWIPVETNTIANGTTTFSDSDWANLAGRFFRLSEP